MSSLWSLKLRLAGFIDGLSGYLISKLELRASVAVVRTFCSPNSKVTPVSQHCLDNFCELVHEKRNSIANALELRLPCTEPKICPIHYLQSAMVHSRYLTEFFLQRTQKRRPIADP